MRQVLVCNLLSLTDVQIAYGEPMLDKIRVVILSEDNADGDTDFASNHDRAGGLFWRNPFLLFTSAIYARLRQIVEEVTVLSCQAERQPAPSGRVDMTIGRPTMVGALGESCLTYNSSP